MFSSFFFHGKRGQRKLLLCSDGPAFSLPLASARRLQSKKAVTLADREGSCDNKLQNTLRHGGVHDFMNILLSDSKSPVHFLGPCENSELSAHSFG